MRRILIALVLILSYSYSFGQSAISQNEPREVFDRELKCFIDTVRPNSIARGKYNVFVARFHEMESDENFCFTLGTINNEYEIDDISADYVYYFEKEIVLIRVADEKKCQKIFGTTICKKMEQEDSLKVSSKLYPEAKGGITGFSNGLVYCKRKDRIEKEFFKNSDLIPRDISIYAKFPDGAIIQKISK